MHKTTSLTKKPDLSAELIEPVSMPMEPRKETLQNILTFASVYKSVKVVDNQCIDIILN